MTTTKNEIKQFPKLKDFQDIKYWIFDIDDTLYPKSSGLDKLIEDSISHYIANYFNLSLEEANDLCVAYYKKFGSTICGLMQTTDIKPNKFVREVHRHLDLSAIEVNVRLEKALANIHNKKYVFTNGSYCHGLRICKKLGIEKHIDGFFGAQSTNFIPKPDPRAFEEFFRRYNIPPHEAILFDDNIKNLETINKMGAKTVWVAYTPELLSEKQPLPDYISYATTDITTWLENLVK